MSSYHNVGMFYASDWGHTEKVAKLIESEWGDESLMAFDLALEDIEKAEYYEHLIFGISTGEGHLPTLDWKRAMERLGDLDLSGKVVALFGLGDQKEYPDHFADALGILYERVAEQGGTVIGDWWDNEYSFNRSRAFKDGCFVGLVIDEDNQQDLTLERIKEWIKKIQSQM